ncbi:MAG: hypothetical protein RJA09_405 [Pseudomonadota bacterium]
MTTHRTPPQPPVPIGLARPFSWLARGGMDLLNNPWPGLLHGALLALFGAALAWVARDQFWWLAGAFSGFLIVAPVLATGLYAVSRGLEHGQLMAPAEVWRLWRSRDRRLVQFGLLLGLAGTGWVLTSAGLITLWSPVPIHKPEDFFRHVVLADDPGLFEAWMLLGALLAAPVFASSVITLPLLVDTPLPVWVAVRQSWRVVADHPQVMVLWALCMVVLVGLGMLTALVGLVVVVPVLGHASWHAYRDLCPQPMAATLP